MSFTQYNILRIPQDRDSLTFTIFRLLPQYKIDNKLLSSSTMTTESKVSMTSTRIFKNNKIEFQNFQFTNFSNERLTLKSNKSIKQIWLSLEIYFRE